MLPRGIRRGLWHFRKAKRLIAAQHRGRPRASNTTEDRESTCNPWKACPAAGAWSTTEWCVISHRPVSAFPAAPDKRVQALQDWAKGEIDRLVPLVPGYEAAPVGPVATKVDKDED